MLTKKRTTIFTALLLTLTMLAGMLSLTAAAAEPVSANTFTFTSSGVTAASAGDGYEIDGTALTITADGTYTVTGSCSEGSIKVKKGLNVTLLLKNLTLASGTTAPLTIAKSANVTLYTSGTVTLTDREDASTEETNTDFEGAAIKVKSGASLTLTGTGTLTADGSACKNGIKGASEATITVAGGTLIVKAAQNGLASDGELIITGGNITVTAGQDGIKSDPDEDDTTSKGSLTITGGTVTVSAGDDAIKALYDLTIGTAGSASGPSITVTKSTEGLEAARITLNSGSGTIKATDDGINAATSAATSPISLTINGGTWTVDAEGDGLDAGGDSTANAGGSIYVNGGTTIVLGAANNGNSALDYDTRCTFSGGTLLAVGTNGMAQTAQGTGVVFSANITRGAALSVRNASGEELISATATRSANWVYLASDALTQGETVTLYVSGKAAATATVGTTSSSAGMGGMGGRMPGMGGTENQTPGMNGQQPAFGGAENQMPGMGGQRPAFGGAENQMPGMNGEMPTFGDTENQMPGMGGRQPAFGSAENQMPGINGQMPAFGDTENQMPGVNGQMPAFGGAENQMPGLGGQRPAFGGAENQMPAFGGAENQTPGMDSRQPASTQNVAEIAGTDTDAQVNNFIAWLYQLIAHLQSILHK
ncbi:MAG: carbohydrate-binding domain-containing protein [bacterium]